MLAAADGNVTDDAPENVLGVPLVAVTDGASLAAELVWTVGNQNVWTAMRHGVQMDISPHRFWIRLDRRAGHARQRLRLPAPRRHGEGRVRRQSTLNVARRRGMTPATPPQTRLLSWRPVDVSPARRCSVLVDRTCLCQLDRHVLLDIWRPDGRKPLTSAFIWAKPSTLQAKFARAQFCSFSHTLRMVSILCALSINNPIRGGTRLWESINQPRTTSLRAGCCWAR
jgi:hypothetical protein